MRKHVILNRSANLPETICERTHQRLLLEEKLSPKVTDEVLPQYVFA